MSIPMQNGGGIHNQTTPALAAKDAEIASLRAELNAATKAGLDAIATICEKEREADALRAEMEGLKNGIEKALDELEDAGPKAMKHAAQELRAAMGEGK